MIKFRRVIAIFVLTLFTCQSIMACVGEHLDYSTDTSLVNDLHLDAADHGASSSPDHDPANIPDLVDSSCCHAHGHCHFLAFSTPVASVSIPPSHGIAAVRGSTYSSPSLNTLLRPPAHA